MRRTWYQDMFGAWHRDRRAERGTGGRGMPAKWAVITLMVLAGLLVLASLASHGSSASHP